MKREEKIQQLYKMYGWNIEELNKHNDAQIDTLYNACLDEDSKLRKTQ